MRRFVWIIAAFLAVMLYFWGQAGTQRALAFNGSDLDSSDRHSHFLSIIDSIPPPYTGLSRRIEVSDDTSFGVLIESLHGINLTDPGSIRFTIDDGVHYVYRRDLSSDAVRVVEVADEDPQTTLLWAVYERSLETLRPSLYFPDTMVQITVQVMDVNRNRLAPQQFRFKIEPDPGHPADFDRLPDYEFIKSDKFTPEDAYDSGVEILSGDLEGAKIIYNRKEPLTPGFGPLDEIEALNLADSQGVGAPLNLLPHTVFHAPVKIFIPFPEGTDITQMDIFYHNGTEWLPACDSDGNLLTGGTGWMVPGSRVNHIENRPPLVEIQVYHFSAAQGGFLVASTGTNRDTDHSNRSGTVVFVKCFIETAAYEANPVFGLPTLAEVLGLVGLLAIMCWSRRSKESK